MAKNQVQFQKGYSLFEFMQDYGTEEQCEQALLAWRYPQGFVCRECGNRRRAAQGCCNATAAGIRRL